MADDGTVGARIRKIRNDRGLSLAEVGRALGCDRSNISHLERGAHEPSVQQLEALANLFGCSIDALVRGELPVAATKESAPAGEAA